MARHPSKKPPRKQPKPAAQKRKTAAKHPAKPTQQKPRAARRKSPPPRAAAATAAAPPPRAATTVAASLVGVPHTHPLQPPDADGLRASHDLHVVPVTASSSIEAKVTRVLGLLRADPAAAAAAAEQAEQAGPRKPVLVALVARAPAANKCVSVAEIAKREVRRRGEGGASGSCCQYTGMWTRLEEREERAGEGGAADADEGRGKGSDEEASDAAFESPEGAHGETKVRGMPCLVVYLATEPVNVLQKAYG
jgi:hypothetical protein